MGLKLSPSKARMHLETGRNIEDIRGDPLCVSAPNKRSGEREDCLGTVGTFTLLVFFSM